MGTCSCINGEGNKDEIIVDPERLKYLSKVLLI